MIAYIDDILSYSSSYMPSSNPVVLQGREMGVPQRVRHILGKCYFMQRVKMDQSKVQAITKRPEPTTIKELHCFLGFVNFYRSFISNYSTITSPLTSMLRGKPKTLSWTDQARAAFNGLKHSFTTAPILCHPDSDLPFLVEVEAFKLLSGSLGSVFYPLSVYCDVSSRYKEW